MSNTSFRNFNFKPEGLRSEFSTNTLKDSSYLPLQRLKVCRVPVVWILIGIFICSLMFAKLHSQSLYYFNFYNLSDLSNR